MQRITSAIVVILLCTPYLLSGSSPGDGDNGWLDSPVVQKQGRGEFYARVLHEHDVHDVNLYEAEVKVTPSTGEWPGVSVSNETIKETNIHTLIRVRGLSAPADHLSRLRPHVHVEQEREFFVDAMSFVWKVLSAHEYLILKDPALVESPAGSGAYVTEVDAFIEIGGIRVSLADTIIYAGHADRGTASNHDWGKRQVPQK